jgi:hypothetical protein
MENISSARAGVGTHFSLNGQRVKGLIVSADGSTVLFHRPDVEAFAAALRQVSSDDERRETLLQLQKGRTAQIMQVRCSPISALLRLLTF